MQTIARMRKLLADNSTSNTLTARTPTATKPTGAGILDLLPGGYIDGTRGVLKLVFFGTDADDETFDYLLHGWNFDLDRQMWIPQEICQLGVILSSVATGETTEFIADTITITHGTAEQGIRVVSNAANRAAFALIELPGVELLDHQFDIGTAATCNAWFMLTESQL